MSNYLRTYNDHTRHLSDMNDWQQEWQLTERDNRLHELATRYHTVCEAYDRTVCTGPVWEDGIMPATLHEMVLINRNANTVRRSLEEEAQREGIGLEELSLAIRKWHGPLPNATELTGALKARPNDRRE